MSNTSIMSVREMIDSAFGELENNTVHFKLIQTILYILARQLRLLERRVGLVAPLVQAPSSTISITEIKLKANVRKKKIQSPTGIGKRTMDKTTKKSSSNKTTSDQTQSSTSKSTTKTSTDQSSSSKTTTTQTTTTSSSKTSSDPTKTTTETSSSRTKSSSKSTSNEEKRKKEFYNMLQRLEEEREREIRIIHQVRTIERADSHDDAVTSPTPMASVNTMEVQYEKLLVVERIPSDEARSTRGRKKGSAQVSVVTQDQFEELAQSIREIQNKFGATGKADFPENAELMQELRRGASLTDAMAALQLSARLEAAEKTLQQMITLVTDLAVRKGVNLDLVDDQEDTPATKRDSRPPKATPSKSSKAAKAKESSIQASKSKISNIELNQPEALMDINVEESLVPTGNDILEIELKKSNIKQNLIQTEDLENALKELYDGILKAVNNITNKTTVNAENALKTAIRLEGKLGKALDLGDRMNDLEAIVSQYVEQINVMDTNLSSQMTNYQEQLTQMQHDLESGLEAMAEAMANTGGDTVAVAELNAHFTDLQVDFDSTNTRQKELKEYQDSLALDLQALLKQIELLRETKSDRDEVADALRDKAGLGALNGLVSLQQFNAVRGDFEKRIGAAYDKFNNQESIWQNTVITKVNYVANNQLPTNAANETFQKAIDDLLRELHEKADLIQVMSLRDDVNNNLEKLRNRIRVMMEIVGEPRAAAVSRKLFRDTNCISCSTPANMIIEESGTFPILPGFPKTSKRPPTIGAEDESKPKESGDFVCYPGLPIPHPIDERAHVCRRYCGGSHTIVSSTLSRAPTGMIITSMPQNTSTALGTDGKVYKTDDTQRSRKPCNTCNQTHMKTPEASEAETAPRDGSDMMPWDYQEFKPTDIAEDITPPPPADDLD